MNQKVTRSLARCAGLSLALMAAALVMQFLPRSTTMAWMGDPNTGGVPIISYHSYVEMVLIGNANFLPMLTVIATIIAGLLAVFFIRSTSAAEVTASATAIVFARWRTLLIGTAIAAGLTVAATTQAGTLGITPLGIGNSAALLGAVAVQIFALKHAMKSENHPELRQ